MITNKKYKINLSSAKTNKLFYLVASVIIYRKKDKRCLILKRSQLEKAHPGLWSAPGGKLEWQDLLSKKPTRINHDIPNWQGLVESLAKREVLEECGLKICNLKYLGDIIFIRPDKIPVVCLKFASALYCGKVRIAPEFDDFAWVNQKEIKKYKIIKGLDREIDQTIRILNCS